MNTTHSRFASLFGKTALASAVFGGFLLLAGAPGAKANDWDDSNRRAAYAEWRYNQAVEHFGPYSGEARHWAHERHEAYERREKLERRYREHYRDRDDHYYRDHERDNRYYHDRD